jgi:hypothetical protein
MASPSTTKTWQSVANQGQIGPNGSKLTDNQAILWLVKRAFRGQETSPTNPWTVSGSSSSSASGMDSTDRWPNYVDLIWGTGAHSWIVLRQPTIATKFEVCFDLSNSNSSIMTVVVSPNNGFGTVNGGTDGSTSARPTATDEIIIHNNVVWNDNPGTFSTYGYKVCVSLSTDGTCTHTHVITNNYPVTTVIFAVPKNPLSSWTTPWIAGIKGSGGTSTSSARILDWNDTALLYFQPTTTSPIGNLFMGAAFVNTTTWMETTAGQNANSVSSNRAFNPITLISNTVGTRGVWGELHDLYFGDPGITLPTTATDNTKWTYVKDFWTYINSTIWW